MVLRLTPAQERKLRDRLAHLYENGMIRNWWVMRANEISHGELVDRFGIE